MSLRCFRIDAWWKILESGHTLPETDSSPPETRPSKKKQISSSNHWISGAIVVSGGYYMVRICFPPVYNMIILNWYSRSMTAGGWSWVICTEITTSSRWKVFEGKKFCWLMDEVRLSPVEVGSLSDYLQGFSTISGGWGWDFWTINRITIFWDQASSIHVFM